MRETLKADIDQANRIHRDRRRVKCATCSKDLGDPGTFWPHQGDTCGASASRECRTATRERVKRELRTDGDALSLETVAAMEAEEAYAKLHGLPL